MFRGAFPFYIGGTNNIERIMNRHFTFIAATVISGACISCSDFFSPADGTAQGELILGFEREMYMQTKALADIPDTNEFILTVTDSKGKNIYSGAYGAAPLSILANDGTYTVSVVSAEFKAPAWDCPQYGDRQTVKVKSGSPANVQLLCRQLNAGVRLSIDKDFLSVCPDGALLLKSADGRLMYSYTERRTAYFNPGKVSLILSEGNTDKTLLTRTLAAQEILTVNVNVNKTSGAASSGIQIQVDTSRNWTNADCTIGGNGNTGGSSRNDAMSVGEAKSQIGKKSVWVYGYIVGGDLTSSSASFETPFRYRTNLAIASKSSCIDKDACLSIQLPSGSLRDELNLVDNPDNLGRKVFLKGDIVSSYYGIPGIQNISDADLE